MNEDTDMSKNIYFLFDFFDKAQYFFIHTLTR